MTLNEDLELQGQVSAEIEQFVDGIGEVMKRHWPAYSAFEPSLRVDDRDENDEPLGGPGLVPYEAVLDISAVLTSAIAEILQAWLDAGSEREVTLEDLGPAIEVHVWGWSNDPRMASDEMTYDQAREAFVKEADDLRRIGGE